MKNPMFKELEKELTKHITTLYVEAENYYNAHQSRHAYMYYRTMVYELLMNIEVDINCHNLENSFNERIREYERGLLVDWLPYMNNFKYLKLLLIDAKNIYDVQKLVTEPVIKKTKNKK